MTRLRHVGGSLAALAFAAAIAIGSSVEVALKDRSEAVLRLSWSARPERIETCQAQSAEEQAKLPAHMRQSVICEGTSASYRLEVRRDDQVLLDEHVRGGGLRHDRLLYVFREIAQPAGDARITIRLTRVESPKPADPNVPSSSPANAIPDIPSSVALERSFQFRQGRVVLVTYDADRRQFVAVEN